MKKLILLVVLLAATLILPSAALAQAAASIIYVDVDAVGADNGASWRNAHTDLWRALGAASFGDHIWVAKGTYYPEATGFADPRESAFQLENGVEIYGGFDPSVGDDTWEKRDWKTNETILSGDIGIKGEKSDNCYHVFYHPDTLGLGSSAVLDGFTITGGNADGSGAHVSGGGMYNNFASPTVAHCTFSENYAKIGGGMTNQNASSPVITRCVFSGNAAARVGGMYNRGSSPMITHCTFSENAAGLVGGMFNDISASPAITNCIFHGNFATNGDGGGMYNRRSSPTITNSIFSENYAAKNAGGMGNTIASSPTITNCTFAGNTAAGDGGGMHNSYASAPAITNSIFWGNTAIPGGSEIYNMGSTPVISYSDIQGGYPGTGNIDADPLFLDPAGGDYRLASTSPVCDAGDNTAVPGSVTTDFEGEARFTDNHYVPDTGSGVPPIVDMGADEWAPIVIPGVVAFDPVTMNLTSNGSWATVFIELPEGVDPGAIDGATVLLNGRVPAYMGQPGWATPESNDGNLADHDGDGILERMVKFDLAAVKAILAVGEEVLITISGKVGTVDFEGTTTIRVIDEGSNGKTKGKS